MKITFQYSKKVERTLIKYFHDHLCENIKVNLPTDKQIIKDIDHDRLEKILSLVDLKWQEIESSFFHRLEKLQYQYSKHYTCYLSRFGSAGFYLPPNKLVIRIAGDQDLLESNLNIAHELVHLILKLNGQDQNLDYVQVEKKVDRLLTKKEFKAILPNYYPQDLK